MTKFEQEQKIIQIQALADSLLSKTYMVDVGKIPHIKMNPKLDGWKWEFDRAKQRFGVCCYSARRIGLSYQLCLLNSLEEIKDTLLHEIAHAICGSRHNHDWYWKTVAKAIGARGERCYSPDTVIEVPGRYAYACPKCNHTSYKHRRVQKNYACRSCCTKYNHGRFDARFILKLQV